MALRNGIKERETGKVRAREDKWKSMQQRKEAKWGEVQTHLEYMYKGKMTGLMDNLKKEANLVGKCKDHKKHMLEFSSHHCPS